MRRTHFLLLVAGVALLTGCTSRNLEQTVQELTEQNATLSEEAARYAQQIQALEQELSDYRSRYGSEAESALEQQMEGYRKELEDCKQLLSRLSGTADLDDGSLYENHEVSCTLTFRRSGYGIKLRSAPAADSRELCEILPGDEIDVTNILISRETEQTYVRAVLRGGLAGFIPIGRNPYHNGTFSYKETVSAGGTDVTVLNLAGSYGVSEETPIRSAPSEDAEILHEVTHKECGQYHQVDGITADYLWVRVTVGEYTGWIPRSDLYRDIGGPTVYTPEILINWELIDSHEI